MVPGFSELWKYMCRFFKKISKGSEAKISGLGAGAPGRPAKLKSVKQTHLVYKDFALLLQTHAFS